MFLSPEVADLLAESRDLQDGLYRRVRSSSSRFYPEYLKELAADYVEFAGRLEARCVALEADPTRHQHAEYRATDQRKFLKIVRCVSPALLALANTILTNPLTTPEGAAKVAEANNQTQGFGRRAQTVEVGFENDTDFGRDKLHEVWTLTVAHTQGVCDLLLELILKFGAEWREDEEESAAKAARAEVVDAQAVPEE